MERAGQLGDRLKVDLLVFVRPTYQNEDVHDRAVAPINPLFGYPEPDDGIDDRLVPVVRKGYTLFDTTAETLLLLKESG